MSRYYLKNGDNVLSSVTNFSVSDNGCDLIDPTISKRQLEYYDDETSDYYPVEWDQSIKPAKMYINKD